MIERTENFGKLYAFHEIPEVQIIENEMTNRAFINLNTLVTWKREHQHDIIWH